MKLSSAVGCHSAGEKAALLGSCAFQNKGVQVVLGEVSLVLE